MSVLRQRSLAGPRPRGHPAVLLIPLQDVVLRRERARSNSLKVDCEQFAAALNRTSVDEHRIYVAWMRRQDDCRDRIADRREIHVRSTQQDDIRSLPHGQRSDSMAETIGLRTCPCRKA